LIAGVAGGWAEHWQVEPTVVRASLGVLTLVGGLGVALYGAAALLSSPNAGPVLSVSDPAPRNHRREVAIACVTAAVLLAARALDVWPGDAVMLPAVLVAAGLTVVWAPGRSKQHAFDPMVVRVFQVFAGVALMLAGVISMANRTGGLSNVGASAAAIAVVVGGIAILAAPALGRLLRALDDERPQRMRDDARAEVAAHLHDSVLQSLVLIQRSDDSRKMAQLARRQERDLRAWLYGAREMGEPTTLHMAIEAMAVETEADHDLRVEAVVVGDHPLDEQARVFLGAMREAIVNAARHSGAARVDVFVEADSSELVGYVRDTGCGFDPASVPRDRRGISESIVGRVERHGGTTSLTSRTGAGTEVEIRVPRDRR